MASRHLSYRGNIEASTLGDFIARIGTKRTQQPLTSRVSSHWIGPNSHFGSVTTKWLASTPAQQQGLLKNYVRDLYAEKEASLASSGFPRENVAFANSAVNDTGHFYERGGVYRVGPNTKKRLMDPRIGPIACYVRILSIWCSNVHDLGDVQDIRRDNGQAWLYSGQPGKALGRSRANCKERGRSNELLHSLELEWNNWDWPCPCNKRRTSKHY